MPTGNKCCNPRNRKSAETRLLIRTFREMTDITELTPIIMILILSEEELLAMMEDIRKNSGGYRLAA